MSDVFTVVGIRYVDVVTLTFDILAVHGERLQHDPSHWEVVDCAELLSQICEEKNELCLQQTWTRPAYNMSATYGWL